MGQWNVDPLFTPANVAEFKRYLPVVDASFVTTAGAPLAALRAGGHAISFMPNPADASIERGRADLQADLPFDLFYACGNPARPLRVICGQAWHMDDFFRMLATRLPQLRLQLAGVFGRPAMKAAVYQAALEQSALGLALTVAWQRRRSWRQSMLPPHLALGGGLIVLFVLSLSWDATAWAEPAFLWYWGWDGCCILVFVVALADALTASRGYRRRLVDVVVVAAAINAMISVIVFLVFARGWGSDPTRLGGWAETRQPILSAIMMGFAVLLAAAQALQTARWRYAAAAMIGLSFIVLTGSRGPALAVLLSLALLIGGSRPNLFLRLLAAGAAAIGALAVIDYDLIGRVAGAVLLRGNSHRFAIWQLSWHDIRLRPWFGHGPAYRIAMPGEDFPHNLFLSTWLYTGLVGLALLLAYLALVLREGLRAADGPDRLPKLAILLHLLVSGMTDLGQVTRGPGPMWYIFWFSTLFCAARCRPAGYFAVSADLYRWGAARSRDQF